MTSLDFDDTGELAVVSRDDDTLQIYNCREGKHAKELKSQKYGVHLARFSHHAQSIVYASTKVDDTIRFLSTHDNSYVRYFRGHTDAVTSIALCPASDSFLSCARDNTVRLWSLQSTNYQGLLRLHAPWLAIYDPSATVIAVASPPTSTVVLYDVRNYDKPPFAHFDLQPHVLRYLDPVGGGAWTRLDFTNDGKHLVVGTAGAGHLVLDAFTGDLTHFCRRRAGDATRRPPGAPPAPGRPPDAAPVPPGQGDVCVAPDGQFVVGGAGAADDGLVVWDISKPVPGDNKTLQPMADLPCPGKAAVVGYNPRTNLMLSADRDLHFWQPDQEVVG